jgi:hypothetical protein
MGEDQAAILPISAVGIRPAAHNRLRCLARIPEEAVGAPGGIMSAKE